MHIQHADIRNDKKHRAHFLWRTLFVCVRCCFYLGSAENVSQRKPKHTQTHTHSRHLEKMYKIQFYAKFGINGINGNEIYVCRLFLGFFASSLGLSLSLSLSLIRMPFQRKLCVCGIYTVNVRLSTMEVRITFLHAFAYSLASFFTIPFHPSPAHSFDLNRPPLPLTLSFSNSSARNRFDRLHAKKSKCVSISRKTILLLELFAAHPVGHSE